MDISFSGMAQMEEQRERELERELEGEQLHVHVLVLRVTFLRPSYRTMELWCIYNAQYLIFLYGNRDQ